MITKTRIVVGLIAILMVASLPLWRFVTPSFAEELNIINLPVVMKNYPPPPPVFGVEVNSFTNPDVIQLAVDARVSWVRIAAFDWRKIEPSAPVNGVHSFYWSEVPETSLLNISSNQMNPIATVKMTPYWAQKYEGVTCGPIASEHFADFAAFLSAAVQRYSKPPFNVHYWELGNEPDVARGLLPTTDYPFGCWGEENDTYYGGEYYAQMLKYAYPAIKTADPMARVLIGGLLLDCDPNDVDCGDPSSSKFLEGILRNQGANFFDILAYHAYPSFYTPEDPFYWDLNNPKWDSRGGLTIGKLDYIREVLRKYDVSKPIFLDEGGLMCHEDSQYCDPATPEFLDAQASYIIWYYVRALAEGLENATWYTFEGSGWRDVGMIGNDLANPRPAYHVFNFLTSELADANYTGTVDTGGVLHGYAFSKSGKEIWVLWPPDGKNYDYQLPAGDIQVLDKFGNPILVPENGIIKINSPIYIEF